MLFVLSGIVTFLDDLPDFMDYINGSLNWAFWRIYFKLAVKFEE